jgi:hypothetical protein
MTKCYSCGLEYDWGSCPRCKSFKNIEKQTKAQEKFYKAQMKAQGSVGGAGSGSVGVVALVEGLMKLIAHVFFVWPFKIIVYLGKAIANAYTKLFGEIYREWQGLKSGERNKAEAYTRIGFLALAVLLLTGLILVVLNN